MGSFAALFDGSADEEYRNFGHYQGDWSRKYGNSEWYGVPAFSRQKEESSPPYRKPETMWPSGGPSKDGGAGSDIGPFGRPPEMGVHYGRIGDDDGHKRERSRVSFHPERDRRSNPRSRSEVPHQRRRSDHEMGGTDSERYIGAFPRAPIGNPGLPYGGNAHPKFSYGNLHYGSRGPERQDERDRQVFLHREIPKRPEFRFPLQDVDFRLNSSEYDKRNFKEQSQTQTYHPLGGFAQADNSGVRAQEQPRGDTQSRQYSQFHGPPLSGEKWWPTPPKTHASLFQGNDPQREAMPRFPQRDESQRGRSTSRGDGSKKYARSSTRRKDDYPSRKRDHRKRGERKRSELRSWRKEIDFNTTSTDSSRQSDSSSRDNGKHSRHEKRLGFYQTRGPPEGQGNENQGGLNNSIQERWNNRNQGRWNDGNQGGWNNEYQGRKTRSQERWDSNNMNGRSEGNQGAWNNYNQGGNQGGWNNSYQGPPNNSGPGAQGNPNQGGWDHNNQNRHQGRWNNGIPQPQNNNSIGWNNGYQGPLNHSGPGAWSNGKQNHKQGGWDNCNQGPLNRSNLGKWNDSIQGRWTGHGQNERDNDNQGGVDSGNGGEGGRWVDPQAQNDHHSKDGGSDGDSKKNASHRCSNHSGNSNVSNAGSSRSKRTQRTSKSHDTARSQGSRATQRKGKSDHQNPNDEQWKANNGSQLGDNNNFNDQSYENNQWENDNAGASVEHPSAQLQDPPELSIKPYWSTWRDVNKDNPADTDSAKKRSRGELVYIAPEEPLHMIPQKTAQEKQVEHQVKAGRGAAYSHRVGRPEYLDTMEAPYAVFSFKYRSKGRSSPAILSDFSRDLGQILTYYVRNA